MSARKQNLNRFYEEKHFVEFEGFLRELQLDQVSRERIIELVRRGEIPLFFEVILQFPKSLSVEELGEFLQKEEGVKELKRLVELDQRIKMFAAKLYHYAEEKGFDPRSFTV